MRPLAPDDERHLAGCEACRAAADQASKLRPVPTDAASRAMADGTRQIEDVLSGDPTLRSIAQMWNANPLHKVVPLDWAEIVRALRTVALRSSARPETAKSVMELNQDLWRSTLDAWQEAGQRWLPAP